MVGGAPSRGAPRPDSVSGKRAQSTGEGTEVQSQGARANAPWVKSGARGHPFPLSS
jgi:hypothetical protein